MGNVKKTLLDIYRADARPVGVLLTVILYIWGIVLLTPGDTFSVSTVYKPMYTYFPSKEVAEIVWGWVYLITAVISSICLLGTKRKVFHYLLLPGVFLFLYTAISFGRVSLYAIGPWLHGLFALAMLWRFIRRSQDII